MVREGSLTWFPGGEGRTSTERSFLARLRREASTWSELGIAPQSTLTVAHGMDVPLSVCVDIPELPVTWPALHTLQITFWEGHRWAAPVDGPVLQGSWTVDHRAWCHDGDDPET